MPVRQLFLLPCLTWKYSSLSNYVDVFFNEILKTPKDVDKRSEFFPPELFCSFSSIAPRCMHSSMPSFCCRGIGDANDKLYLICTMCHRVQKGSMQNGCLLAHLPTTTQRSRTFFSSPVAFYCAPTSSNASTAFGYFTNHNISLVKYPSSRMTPLQMH